MRRLQEMFVFFPRESLEAGWLWGAVFRRSARRDIIAVVMGVDPPKGSSSGLQLESVKSCVDFWSEVQADEVSVEWIGWLGDDMAGASSPQSLPLYMEWRKNENGIPRLERIRLEGALNTSLPIKVFLYEPAAFGVRHYPVTPASHLKGPTVFQFAVGVINRRSALLQEFQQSSTATQSTPLSENIGMQCMSKTVDADRSVPFELGRLLMSWEHKANDIPRQSTADQNCVALHNEAFLAQWHKMIARIVRDLAGIFVTCLLIAHKDASLSTLRESAAWLHSFLDVQSIWLAGSPAGIKLHRPLAEFYSACLSLASDLTWHFHSALLDILAHIWMPSLAILSLTGGSIFLATLSDVIYIAHLPLTAFYAGFSLLAFLHFKALRMTWLLLRGHFAREKRKQKRKEASTRHSILTHFGREKKDKDDEILMEHLIVGVLLFTPSLGLLPTTLVFLCLISALQFIMLAARCLVTCCMNTFISNPAAWLILRLWSPALFPEGLSIDEMEAHGTSLVSDSRRDAQEEEQISCWY